MTPGVDYADDKQVAAEISTLIALRDAAIDVIRKCDSILYGRDDKTIPRRRR